MIRARILDFDDTVVDGSEAVKQAAFFECIRRFWDSSLIEWAWDGIRQDLLYNSGSNTRKRLETLSEGKTKEAFIDFYNKNKETVFVEIINQYPITVFDDVIRNLRTQERKGIFTDSSRGQIAAVLNRFPELRELFHQDNIITQDDVWKRKPDPEGLQKLLAQWSISPEEVQYIDDGWGGIQAAVRARIGQIFLLERQGTERKPKNLDQATWLRTGQIMKARTLDVLNQTRQPFVMILRGRQYAGKGFVWNRLGIPFAMINKDYIAEMHGMQRRNNTEYEPIRDRLYELFTESTLASIERYGYVCLDAPFTSQKDVDKMIGKLRAKYPQLRVLVATVESSQEERQSRMAQWRQEEFPEVVSIGMQHIVPPNDAFESEFDDTIEPHDNRVGSIILQNSRDKVQNFNEPIQHAMERLLAA